MADLAKKGLKDQNGQSLVVREFQLKDKPEVQRIFYEGLMEMVPDTAFRGLRHHPEILLLYTAITGKTHSRIVVLSFFKKTNFFLFTCIIFLIRKNTFSSVFFRNAKYNIFFSYFMNIFLFFHIMFFTLSTTYHYLSFGSCVFCHHKMFLADRTPPSHCGVFALLLQ